MGRKPNTQVNLQAAGIKVNEYGGIPVDYELKATASGNRGAAGRVLAARDRGSSSD
jgi:pyruvate/2-oxoglutarate dehydrogenase complex dihydrolipoamide dehydrogenase (E3) component